MVLNMSQTPRNANPIKFWSEYMSFPMTEDEFKDDLSVMKVSIPWVTRSATPQPRGQIITPSKFSR